MNRRKIIIFFVFGLFLNYLFYSQDYTFFKHLSTVNIDYKTGDTLFSAYDPYHLEKIDVVKNMKIKIWRSKDDFQYVERSYSLGKIIRQYNKANEITDFQFVYNDLGYLVEGINQKRVYSSKNECIVYKNDKPEKRIKLTEDINNISVVIEKYYPDKNYYLSNSYTYFYEDKNLKKLDFITYNKKGDITSIWNADFEYKNQFLKRQLIKIKNQKRWEYIYFYNDNKLSRIDVIDYLNSSQNKIILFKNYDLNGNWLISEEYQDNSLCCEIKREIDYQNVSFNSTN